MDVDISDLNMGRSHSLRPRASKLNYNYNDNSNDLSINTPAKGKRRSKVENVYLQTNPKQINVRPTSLETIYESPRGNGQSLRDYMGIVKLKRQCRFVPFYNPSKVKIKLRKSKSKNLKRIGVKVPTGCSITQEQVEQALQSISEGEENDDTAPFRPLKRLKGDSVKEKMLKFAVHKTRKEECPSMNLSDNPHFVENSKQEDENIGCDLKFSTSNQLHLQAPLHIDIVERSLSPLFSFNKKKKLSDSHLQNNNEDITKSQVQPMSNENSTCASEEMDVVKEQTICDGAINSTYSILGLSIRTDFDDPESQHFVQRNSSKKSERRKKESRRNSGIHQPLYKETRRNSGIHQPLYKETRRLSGIHQPLYKGIPSTSPESLGLSFDEHDTTNVSADCFPEPSSLLEQLNIHSPTGATVGVSSKIRKGRRKSARLSISGIQSVLGSFWSQSPKKNSAVTDAPIIQDSDNGFQTSQKDDILQTSAKSITTFEPVGCIAEADKINSVSALIDSVKPDDSPVISGIFDCKARLCKDRSFVMKKGSELHVTHINTNLACDF